MNFPDFPDHRRDSDAGRLLHDLSALADHIERQDRKLHVFAPSSFHRSRLLSDAEDLFRRFPDPAGRPPLFAMPVGVKDVFRCDGFPTACGALVPAVVFEGPEAPCVTRLREAGALVIGKTVTTEFAYFEPGPTRNPLRPAHTPGGSSSGSAAGVAAGFFPLALGTQTVGSVIRPASFCGVVGVKPDRDRVSTEGVIPFAATVDQPGLFARTPDLAAAAMAALIPDWNPDHDTLEGPIRLALPVGPYLEQAPPEAMEVLRRALGKLEAAGCRVIEVPEFPDIAALGDRHERLISGDMARSHAAWFAEYGFLYRPKTVAMIRKGETVSEAEMAAGHASRRELAARLERRLAESGADAWISPAAPGEAPEGHASTGNPVMNLPWSHAGVPVAALPAGNGPGGLPIGVQLAAGPRADERLMALIRRLGPMLAG